MERLIRAEIEHVNADTKVISELLGRFNEERDAPSMLSRLLLRLQRHQNCVVNLVVLIDGEAWSTTCINKLKTAQLALEGLEDLARSMSTDKSVAGTAQVRSNERIH